MLNKFIYIDSKEEFQNLLNQGEVLDEAIVFIEDTREIWNHGTYFDGKSIDDCVSNQQFNELLSASNYEFVDLGLPSGLKWATCNIGANSPEEGGLYFAWGETEGHTKDTERIFNTDSYKHYKDGEYTKYTIYTFEKRDDLTTLEPCDDAAYVLDTCRMPTKDDFEELVNNTDFKHIQVKGINVLKCISRVNDNYILIPLAGSYCQNGSKLLFSGEMAMLWSSSLDCSHSLSRSSAGAYILQIDLTESDPYVDTTYRDFGVNIRPVQDSNFSSKTNFKDILLKIFNLKEELKATKTEIPTKVSQLENNSNYITKTEVFNSYQVKGNYALESDIEIENGVYAVDANGELIDYNTADSSALGVALVVGEHKFMIANSDATNDGSNRYLYWTKSTSDLLLLTNNTNVDGTNSEGYLPKPDGTFAGSTKAHLSGDFTTWTTGALSDFNGKDNTTVIAASSSDVKDICTVLNTFNTTTDSNNIGKNDWYVPACGQLALMWLNKKEINEAFAKIGGNALADEYWSSSEKSATYAWIVDLYNGYIYQGYKSNDSKVRFVRNLPVKTLNERITNLETSKQDVISDLEEIRSGSALGATALQAQDLNNYALSVSGQINNINSNMNGVSSEVANVKRIAEAAQTKATNNESVISQCATKNELNTAIADLVDSAPETLNTLNELATAISEHKDVTDALDAAIANKANKTEIPTKVSQLENDVPYALKSDVEVGGDAPNGVYAVTADGKLIDYHTADSSCIGVAFISANQKVMIAKANATDGTNTKLYWGKNLYEQDVPNLEYLADDTAAKADYNGKANTEAIIAGYAALGKDMDSRDMCKVLETYNEGGYIDWYVPAAGQLYEIYTNRTAINQALTAIGSTAFKSNGYWSSSDYSSSHARSMDFFGGSVSYYSKNKYTYVRFVRDLSPKSLKEKVIELEQSIPTKLSQLENDANYITASDLNAKQDTLVSGTNIKTINGESILGSGDIIINNSFGGGIPIVEELDPDASLGTLVRYKQNINIDKVEIINKTCSIKDLTYRTLDPDNDYYNYVIKGDIITKINFLMPNVENIPSKFKQECCAEFIICSNTEWFGMGVCYDQGSFEVYGFDGRVWEIISNNQINQEGMEQLDNFFNNSKIYYSGIFLYPDSPISIEECFDLLDYFITVNAIKEINTTEEITKVVPYIKQQYGWESLITENSDFNNDFNFDFD